MGGATTGWRTAAGREPPILSMGISLPRPVSNPYSCLIPKKPKYRPGGIDGVTFEASRCRSVEATGEGRGEDGRNGGHIGVRAA